MPERGSASEPKPLPSLAPMRTVAVREISELSAIFEPDVNVAVFERPVASDLRVAAALPAFGRGFGLTLIVAASPTGSRSLHGRFAPMQASALATDIFFLVELLCELTGSELVGVRLMRLDSAMCPAFHTDRVTLRLVTAYAGAGTEFVAFSEGGVGLAGATCAAASQQLGGDGGRSSREPEWPAESIRRASAGDVVLLKGEAWPGNKGRAAVHRSPLVDATSSRLLLTLDAL